LHLRPTVVHTRFPRALTMPSRVTDGVSFTYLPHYQWLLTEPILKAFLICLFRKDLSHWTKRDVPSLKLTGQLDTDHWAKLKGKVNLFIVEFLVQVLRICPLIKVILSSSPINSTRNSEISFPHKTQERTTCGSLWAAVTCFSFIKRNFIKLRNTARQIFALWYWCAKHMAGFDTPTKFWMKCSLRSRLVFLHGSDTACKTKIL